MDLGGFAEQVLDTVAGICGDTVVESHDQAAHVLDSLLRRPGAERRELAAVFGVSLIELDSARSKTGDEEATTEDPVYTELRKAGCVHVWNTIIERINQAAHWREEFRDLQFAGGEGDEDDEPDDASSVGEAGSTAEAAGVVAGSEARSKARAMIAKRLDAPEGLRRRLVERLEDEIFENTPGDKEYRHSARALAANLRRNTMLAAGYAAGRVPPQWMTLADDEALAPRMAQLQRRLFRKECLWETRMDDESAQRLSRAWKHARGENLQEPAPNEDPYE